MSALWHYGKLRSVGSDKVWGQSWKVLLEIRVLLSNLKKKHHSTLKHWNKYFQWLFHRVWYFPPLMFPNGYSSPFMFPSECSHNSLIIRQYRTRMPSILSQSSIKFVSVQQRIDWCQRWTQFKTYNLCFWNSFHVLVFFLEILIYEHLTTYIILFDLGIVDCYIPFHFFCIVLWLDTNLP